MTAISTAGPARRTLIAPLFNCVGVRRRSARSLRPGAWLYVLVVLAVSAAAAPGQNLPAQQLVHQVVVNEQKADAEDTSQWMYVSRKLQAGRTEIRNVVETKQGTLSRLVSVNGKSLSAEDQHQEDQSIQKLVHDPDELKKQQEAQENDRKKAHDLLDLIRQAFLFEYASRRGRIVRLTFQPNPAFKPESREAEVLHSMAGTMLIDRREKRLAGLSGHMVKDVTFGAGILGRLQKGGTFALRRKEIMKGRWETTLIDVHLKGRALLFKSISEQQHETRSNFRRVPENLSLAQAAELLRGQAPFARNGR